MGEHGAVVRDTAGYKVQAFMLNRSLGEAPRKPSDLVPCLKRLCEKLLSGATGSTKDE